MTRLSPLPRIMLAPNGARRGKADHPALPMTIAETVAAARDAFAQGAGALHAHLRDDRGGHLLDAGAYRELIAEMAVQVPGMAVQVTTEAVGLYTPDQQRALVRDLRPEGISVALREMWPGPDHDAQAARFYHWCAEAGTAVQHLLFDADETARLAQLVRAGHVPGPVQVLFVLGNYAPPRPAAPGDLPPFLAAARAFEQLPDWAACAFGPPETRCLETVIAAGGKARIGFENNFHNADGTLARDNAERVADLVSALARRRAC